MSSETHFSGKVAAKALIVKDDKILLIRASKDNETWDLPGGRINVDEEIENALKREVKEELDLDVNIEALLSSKQIIHSFEKTPHIFLIFKAVLVDPHQPIHMDPKEAEEYLWIDKEAFNKVKIYDGYDQAFKNFWKL